MNANVQVAPKSNLLAAIAASKRYPIFPCNPVDHPTDPKAPRTKNSFKDATQNEFQIMQWWVAMPDSLIGVPTGAASGLDVVDDDTRKKPDATSSAWIERNCAHLAGTRQQKTNSGGIHFIFRHNPDTDIGARKGITVEGVKLASIDTRGNGGYIIDWGAHGLAFLGEVQTMPPELATQLHRSPAPKATVPIAPGLGLHPAQVAELPAVLRYFNPSDRDDWITVGMALQHAGGEEAFEIFHGFSAGEFTADKQVPANFFGRDDCLATYGSFGRNTTRRPLTIASIFNVAHERSRAPVVQAGPPAAIPPPPLTMQVPADTTPPPPVAVLRMNSKLQYDATLEALVYVLGKQTQASIGFDEFRARIMIAPAGTEEWRPMSDTDMIQLRETLAREQRFAPIGKELMHDALHLVASRHRFDSAITWLNGLTWDGVPRIEMFLVTYCGTLDDEYTRSVSLYIWTGLAGRVLDPGCQLDMVVAFQGRQGKMKSTGFQAMVPADDCFTDGLSLHEDDDDFKRLIRGKLLVEVAELAGLSKGDINVVKRVITRRQEEWIEKFQTQPTRFKRRCMLFASTNEEQFLPPDDTGQRRWLPVEIGIVDRDRIAADRDQLWAEGAVLWRESGIAWKDAQTLAEGRHAKYEQTDVWESTIARWLDQTPVALSGAVPLPPPRFRPLTLSEILEGAIGLNAAHQDARSEKRAARVMRALKFEPRSVRVDGNTASVRRWVACEGPGALPVPPVASNTTTAPAPASPSDFDTKYIGGKLKVPEDRT